MKSIVLYSNCQGIGIKYFLKLSNDINQNYSINHIRIDKLVFKEEDLNFNIIKNADIFIYQILKEKHDIINTNNIIKYLKSDCIKISFPYIYNNSFYPFKGPLNIERSHLNKDTSIIFDNSSIITNLIEKELSLDKIIELYENDKINYNYEERFKYTMNLLEENESMCNIKITKFIYDNFSLNRLFMLENHPTSIIFLEIVNKILNLLNIDKLDVNIKLNDANLPGGLLPIHISSKNFFNFKFYDDNSDDDNSDEYYKHILKNIYNFYKYKQKNLGMENNVRNNVLTNENTMDDIFTLKNFPVSMSCVSLDYKDYKYMDKTFQICKKTGIIQLKQFPSLEDMYLTPHNSTSYGSVWKNLFENVGKKVNKIVNNYNLKNILEIGGGSLLLASKILENKDIDKYIIYEKNSSKIYTNDSRIELNKCYFTEETKINNTIDIVIHSHVLEHTFTPVKFMNSIKNIKPKYHILIVPNLYTQFKKHFTNSFNFEHNILITEPHIDVLLHNHNFEILEKEYYLDHSIIYITKYHEKQIKEIPYPNLYNEYLKLVIDFKEYHEQIVNRINKEINELKGNIYLFGGHIFSLYLIKFGLKTDKILNILDNSKEKENHKLYGTELIVKNPSIIKDMTDVIVIVKAASYQKEIEEQLKDLNNNIIIIK